MYTKVVCSSKLIHIIGKNLRVAQAHSNPHLGTGKDLSPAKPTTTKAWPKEAEITSQPSTVLAINISHHFPKPFSLCKSQPTQPTPPLKSSHVFFRVKCPVRARGQRYVQITWHKAVRPLASWRPWVFWPKGNFIWKCWERIPSRGINVSHLGKRNNHLQKGLGMGIC